MTPQEMVIDKQDELIAALYAQVANLNNQIAALKQIDEIKSILIENLEAKNRVLESYNNTLISLGTVN